MRFGLLQSRAKGETDSCVCETEVPVKRRDCELQAVKAAAALLRGHTDMLCCCCGLLNIRGGLLQRLLRQRMVVSQQNTSNSSSSTINNHSHHNAHSGGAPPHQHPHQDQHHNHCHHHPHHLHPLHTMLLVPYHASLPDGHRVTISIINEHQVTEIFNLVQDAARNGDGYGVDEFPTEKDFLREVQAEKGTMFRICSVDTGKTVAAFVVLNSKYYRGQGTVADSYMVVKRDERMKGIGLFCMQMVMYVAARLGYVSMYCDMFHDNVAMRKIMERSGFQRVGFLPMGARMPDGSLKQSLIYYRELDGVVVPSVSLPALSLLQQSAGDRSAGQVLPKNDSCPDFDSTS